MSNKYLCLPFICVLLISLEACFFPQPVDAPEASVPTDNKSGDAGWICLSQSGYQKRYDDGYNAGFKAALGDNATIHLVNPTYAGLIAFLNTDPSKAHQVDNCQQRARDFSIAARWANFDVWTVLLTYTNGKGHIIMLFHTADGRSVYVEPAYDIIVAEPRKGMDYNDNFVDTPYPPSAESDYIQEVNIIE